MTAIHNLNSQIDKKMRVNDLDFLAAYRGHMMKVQAELDTFKRKTNECEFIIKKDERVQKLQAQLTWFREEALHLSTQLQKQKTSGAQLREKVLLLQNENDNLKHLNTKAVAREKQLKAALAKSQDNCQELLQLVSAHDVNTPPYLESPSRGQQMDSDDDVNEEEAVDANPAFYVTQKYFSDVQRNEIVDITTDHKK